MIQELGVVTPVYNAEKNNRLQYFKDSIKSILAQDYDFLLAVVDDGSTDNTVDYIKSINDSRVKLLERERQPGDVRTSSNALNMGLNHLFEMGCKYFCYFHSDDLLTQGSLESRVGELKDKDMVYGRMVYLKKGKTFSNEYPPRCSDYYSPLILSGDFPHHTSMWSKRMMEVMMGERKNRLFYNGTSEDSEVTLYCMGVLTKNGFNLGFVDNFVYIYRIHKESITGSLGIIENIKGRNAIYEKNGKKYQIIFEFVERPFFWLPENVKEPLRPLKAIVKKASFDLLYPGAALKKIDIDPYWFLEK